MLRAHFFNQGGSEVDVAVWVWQGERKLSALHDLPVGGTVVVGIWQRLGIHQDKSVAVRLVPQISDAQLEVGCSSPTVKAQTSGVASLGLKFVGRY